MSSCSFEARLYFDDGELAQVTVWVYELISAAVGRQYVEPHFWAEWHAKRQAKKKAK